MKTQLLNNQASIGPAGTTPRSLLVCLPVAALAVWCLLPLAMLVACLFIGANDPYVHSGIYILQGTVYGAVGMLYRRVFLVLGALTIILAVVIVVVNRRALFSRASMKQHPWFYMLAILLAWSVVSTLLSDTPLAQFRGSSYRADGLFSYFIYAAILLCALNVQGEVVKRRLLGLFVAVVDVLCVFMLLEAAQVDPFRLIFQSPRAVVFNNMNHFGYVLCMSSLCAAGLFLHEESPRLRAAHAFSFALLTFALLANDTFGCYLAVIVGLVALMVLHVKSGRKANAKLFVPLVVFLALTAFNCCGGMAALSPHTVAQNFIQLFTDVNAVAGDAPNAGRAGSGRMKLWVGALEMIPERPVFGFGPEGLMGEYARAYGLDRPHNEVIQYAVFLGVPGLLLYLGALVALAVRQFRRLRELSPVTIVACAAVIAYFASSLVGNTMFNTMPYFWILLAFAAAQPLGQPAWLSPDCAADSPAAPRAIRMLALAAFAALSALLVSLAFAL